MVLMGQPATKDFLVLLGLVDQKEMRVSQTSRCKGNQVLRVRKDLLDCQGVIASMTLVDLLTRRISPFSGVPKDYQENREKKEMPE